MANKQLDEYLVQQIISRLILPFDRWPAFKYGIISKDGKILKQKNQLKTKAEQDSWGYLDILCCNLRKFLSEYPPTRMRLAQLNMIQNAPLPTVIGQPPTIPLSTLAGQFFLLKEDFKISIKQPVKGSNAYHVFAHDDKGKEIGRMDVRHDGKNLRALGVDVDKEVRRKGVATKMYDTLEKHTGSKFKPLVLSKDAKEFWKKRDPNALKEDAPANAMGGGAIAGGGIGPQGDPPVRKGTILTKVLRRKAKISVANS